MYRRIPWAELSKGTSGLNVFFCMSVVEDERIPWSKALLEMLVLSQLLKKFHFCNGARIYRLVHIRLTLFLLQCRTNLVHVISSYFHFVILPFMSRSSKSLFPSGFPTKTLYAPLLPCTCHMSRPPHCVWCDYLNSISLFNFLKPLATSSIFLAQIRPSTFSTWKHSVL